jgi:hypothetical protein
MLGWVCRSVLARPCSYGHGLACAVGLGVDVTQMPRLCSRAVRSNACKVSYTTCTGVPVGHVAVPFRPGKPLADQ